MADLDPATIRACEAVLLGFRRRYNGIQALGISLALQRVSREFVKLREQAELEQALVPDATSDGYYTRKALDLQAGVRRMRRAS